MTDVLSESNAWEIFGPRPPHVPEFTFLSDIKRGESETWLNYGGSGTGKTRFSGTAGDRTLLINNGNGISTLQSPAYRRDVGGNPIIVTLAEKLGPKGIFDTALVFDAICDTIDYALQKFPDKFDFIVVDDATQLRRGALNKGLEINQKTGKSKGTMSIKEEHNIIIPAIQDFGVEMNLIEQFVAGYTTICKEAGKHFILNAHERLTYKKGDKVGDPPMLAKTSPGFTGQTFPDTIPAYFDNVWHFHIVGGGSSRVWRITTQGHETLIAKTRMAGVFDTTESNLTLLKAVERIQNSDPSKMKAKK